MGQTTPQNQQQDQGTALHRSDFGYSSRRRRVLTAA
jgi:hypothetical protein